MNWDALQAPFEHAVVAPEGDLGECIFFAFQGDLLLVSKERHDHGGILPRVRSFDEIGMPFREPHYLGSRSGVHSFTVDLEDDAKPPADMALHGLRMLYGVLDETTFQLAGRAFQIVNWDRTHHFCGRCGTAADYHKSDRARQCPRCGLLSFPRVSPAVITLIHRGDEFVLARNGRFPKGRYSIIAGFVEAGETLEEGVAREIREEIGIEVTDITFDAGTLTYRYIPPTSQTNWGKGTTSSMIALLRVKDGTMTGTLSGLSDGETSYDYALTGERTSS